MPNPTRIEINCETGVESVIELTDAEVAELAYQAELAAEKKAEEDAAAAALEEQKLADARSITYFVRRRGLYATKFLTNALTPEQIDLLVNTISETLGKQVSLSTSR